MRETITAAGAPDAVGPYSHAVKAAGLLFISGQIPLDPETNEIKGSTAADQARQCLENLATIAQAAGTTEDEIVAYAVFALVGTLGVATPVAIAVALGDRSRRILDGLQAWMTANNAVIMAVLLLVIGTNLVGDAVHGFSA